VLRRPARPCPAGGGGKPPREISGDERAAPPGAPKAGAAAAGAAAAGAAAARFACARSRLYSLRSSLFLSCSSVSWDCLFSALACRAAAAAAPQTVAYMTTACVMWSRRARQGKEATKRWQVGMDRGAASLRWKTIS